MQTLLIRLAEFAASHGQLERFVRAFHALTGRRFALQPIRADYRERR